MAGKSFTVGFRADLTAFTKDVLEGRRTLEEAVQAMVVASQRAGKQGGDGFDKLSRSIMQFKRDQVQQGRLVGFYVRELVEVTGASKEAAAVFSGFGSVLAEAAAKGGAFAIGFEAIKLGVAGFHALTAEADATLKRLHEGEVARLKQVATAADEARQALLRQLGVQSGMRAGDVSPALKQATDISTARSELARLNEELRINAQKQEELRSHRTVATFVGIQLDLRKLTSEAKALNAQIGEVQGNLALLQRNATPFDALRQYRGMGVGATAYITPGEVAEADRVARERGNREALEYARAYQKALREFSLSAWQATKGVDLSRSQGGAFMAQANAAAAAAAAQRTATMGQYAGYGSMPGAGSQTAGLAERLAEERAALEKTQAQWQRYGDAAAGAMAEIVMGHRTMTETVNAALEGMLQGMIKYVLQSILAEAGLTAAKVVEQNASLGPWGWIAGLAQAGAAQAAVMAFGAGIGSAEGGWNLPKVGGPFPAVLHPNEMVLPSEQADAIRALVAGGGGGGGPVTIHVHTQTIDDRNLDELARRAARKFGDEIDRQRRYAPRRS